MIPDLEQNNTPEINLNQNCSSETFDVQEVTAFIPERQR